LSTPDHDEFAQLMLAKARADLSAARLLASDEAQDDAVIGFDAQQACEKSLKAVLAVREIEIPRTHNLGYILDQLEDAGALAEIVWLNPWAVTMRYDEQESSLDRAAALATAELAVAWATEIVPQA
jgi:HEPN domain-containing protein